MSDYIPQLLQLLQQGVIAIFRFVQIVWMWSLSQATRVVESPWHNWPFWKQVLLAMVAAAVIMALVIVASRLWDATERILNAFSGLLVAFVSTLPFVVLAGIVAMGGLWIVNTVNF